MVRYKSSNNNKGQLRGQLEIKSGTKPPTTRLRQKMKLIVYKIDGKLYIDHSAAYALKLTSVRAIMTGKQHLFEIEIGILNKLKENKDIEIEFKEFNKNKEKKNEASNLSDALEGLEQGKYGIGVHGIDQGNIQEKQGIANSINQNGLNINNNSRTILGTSISLGTNEDNQNINQEIIEYQFGSGLKINVVIAVPLCIQNENGDKIFLGFPNENKRTAGQQYEDHCILDIICARMKKIPTQFILGYYCENPDGTDSFIKNEQHYSNIMPEDRENFFEELYSYMDDFSKNVNGLIANGDIERLEQMQEGMSTAGLSTSLINNAINLAQKLNNDKGRKPEIAIRKILMSALAKTYPGNVKDLKEAERNLPKGPNTKASD